VHLPTLPFSLLKLTGFIVMLSPAPLLVRGEASGLSRRKNRLFKSQILRFTSFRSE
jgi:hypothetical protein